MNYHFTFNEQNQFLQTKISGELNLETLPGFGTDLVEELGKYGCDKVLHDCREAKLEFTMSDYFEIPKIVRQRDLRLGIRRAIVYQNDAEKWTFYETIAANRGENVRVFTSFEKAKEWLLGDEKIGG